MPIYEYKCGACGFQKEFLQRLSDAPLKDCPECGKAALSKMVTAAGFQLKGSGWYATDFKTAQTKPADKSDATSEAKSDAKADAKADAKSDAKSGDKAAVKADAKPAAETAAKKSDAPAAKTTPAATPTTSN
jgi:putative FmdB family regulatory protein